MREVRTIVLALLVAAAVGLGAAWAATTATIDTNVACATATATVPDHTVGVDGTAVDTISGTSTTASQCNTVTYTVPTVTQTVTASTTSSPTTSTTSSTSTTTTSSTTSGPPTTGAAVPAAPTGPTTPAGGWAVEYADAFGACFTDTATRCSAGYTRADDTLAPATHANGAGNSNEIAGLEPSMVDVKADGLYLHCDPAAVTANTFGDPDTCGAVTGGAYNTSAPGAFHWTPTASTHFVLQASFQLPPNQGNMDPSFWSNGPNDNPEVDHLEAWGMNHVPPAGAANTWCGFQFGDPAVPFDSGGATGNVQATFCQSTGANLDPSDGQHVWTLDENGTTLTSYVDGVKIGSKTYSGFNTGSAAFKLLLMASMRKDAASGQNYPLPAGGNDLLFRYVAVYEPASANNAGLSCAAKPCGPVIAPGTTVTP